MTIAILWLIAAVGGIFEWHNHRRFAALCMLVTLTGFTLEANRPSLPALESMAQAQEYVGLSVGGLYHVSRDPACRLLSFPTASAAEQGGWQACPECVLPQELSSSKPAEKPSGERGDRQKPALKLIHEQPPVQ